MKERVKTKVTGWYPNEVPGFSDVIHITHVGGIDSIADATMNLPSIPDGKKLAYTQFEMPLTAIDDFEKLSRIDPLL